MNKYGQKFNILQLSSIIHIFKASIKIFEADANSLNPKKYNYLI